MGCGKASDSRNPAGNSMPQTFARRFIFLPGRSRDVTPDHTFYRKHLRPLHHHRSAMQLVSILLQVLRVTAHIRRDEVVGNNVRKKVEPEQRDLAQHASLMRNAGAKHIIEGRNSVCGHEQQLFAVEFVDVANFSASVKLEVREVCL